MSENIVPKEGHSEDWIEEDKISFIEKRLEAATAGDWECYQDKDEPSIWGVKTSDRSILIDCSKEDGMLIAHMKLDAKWLVKKYKELLEENKSLRQKLQSS